MNALAMAKILVAEIPCCSCCFSDTEYAATVVRAIAAADLTPEERQEVWSVASETFQCLGRDEWKSLLGDPEGEEG